MPTTRFDQQALIVTLLANMDTFEDHEIEDMYRKVVGKKIKEIYGVYISQGEISASRSITENWQVFFDTHVKPKYKDMETYKKFYEFKDIKSCIYRLEGNTLYVHGMSMNNLINLLEYVIHGLLHEDYAVALKIIDNFNNASHDNFPLFKYDTPAWEPTNFDVYGDIKIRKYKNGKVIISGLSQEQLARLEEIVEILHR